MEDEADIYNGIRAQFPVSFGKQSKAQVSLESIHNATRRPSTTAASVADHLPSSSSAFPALSTSSEAWLDSVKKTPSSSRNSANPNPNDDDVTIGPPRPPPVSDSNTDVQEDDDNVIIGPPRPVEVEDDDDEGEMIGPPRPPPVGSDIEDEGESDGEEENSHRIPLSNEIVLKGHTKVLPPSQNNCLVLTFFLSNLI